MTEAIAVVMGLVCISFLFLYSAFTLRDSDVKLMQNISVLLAFVGLVFINLTVYAIFRIADQTQAINYLASGVMLTGLRVIIAITSLLTFTLLLSIIFGLIKMLKNSYKRLMGRRVEENETPHY